ncbi:MAG: hypothetical protein ACXAC5_02590 [Promethearchaeota archaeon]
MNKRRNPTRKSKVYEVVKDNIQDHGKWMVYSVKNFCLNHQYRRPRPLTAKGAERQNDQRETRRCSHLREDQLIGNL